MELSERLVNLQEEERQRIAQELHDSTAQHLVAAKAEGNPFFIEEVTRALIEIGALQVSGDAYTLAGPLDRIRIPDTIQEVILSRIDRLEREAREALQLASVIGREFTVRLLRRISDLETKLDASLGELKALELIYQTAYYPELAFMFKHALTHDVTYATLLIERRKALVAREGLEPEADSVLARAVSARRIGPGGVLELDHLGAVVPEEHPGERRREERRRLDHPDAGERLGAHGRSTASRKPIEDEPPVPAPVSSSFNE